MVFPVTRKMQGSRVGIRLHLINSPYPSSRSLLPAVKKTVAESSSKESEDLHQILECRQRASSISADRTSSPDSLSSISPFRSPYKTPNNSPDSEDQFENDDASSKKGEEMDTGSHSSLSPDMRIRYPDYDEMRETSSTLTPSTLSPASIIMINSPPSISSLEPDEYPFHCYYSNCLKAFKMRELVVSHVANVHLNEDMKYAEKEESAEIPLDADFLEPMSTCDDLDVLEQILSRDGFTL